LAGGKRLPLEFGLLLDKNHFSTFLLQSGLFYSI
jgi:hypothetical protein